MSNAAFADTDDVRILWRALTTAEQERAEALLPVISDALRVEAGKVGKNLDDMIDQDLSGAFANVAKSVTVDILSRMLMAPTDEAPLSQFSQGALGYSVSGTYLSPGGGLFIKNAELARLGIRRQKMGAINLCR